MEPEKAIFLDSASQVAPELALDKSRNRLLAPAGARGRQTRRLQEKGTNRSRPRESGQSHAPMSHTRASRWTRETRSLLCLNASDRNFMATLRLSFVSVAWYTSPMRPDPM